jgi:A/G-specific adenine glycosylase
MVATQDAHAAPSAQAARKAAELRVKLLAWYGEVKRDVPWRRTRDPYAVWVSEVMLQQTRVETVVPYYVRFLETFPTLLALAEAPTSDVLALWSGLGYYRRARMLHEGARHVASALGGTLPETTEGLRTIPGIGPYTAGAVASIAFGRRAALVDGNVARVLARLFAIEDDVRGRAGLARVWRLAEGLVGALAPEDDPGAWNQALMELGATVCTPRDPRCLACPARELCAARATGKEHVFPRVAPKPRPRDEARVALVATRGSRVLLARRRADGRFGGMWEPPSALGADSRALEALCGRLGPFTFVGVVRHVLSHRRLEIRVFTARISRTPRAGQGSGASLAEYDAFELVPYALLDARGVTTLARKILRAASRSRRPDSDR